MTVNTKVDFMVEQLCWKALDCTCGSYKMALTVHVIFKLCLANASRSSVLLSLFSKCGARNKQ